MIARFILDFMEGLGWVLSLRRDRDNRQVVENYQRTSDALWLSSHILKSSLSLPNDFLSPYSYIISWTSISFRIFALKHLLLIVSDFDVFSDYRWLKKKNRKRKRSRFSLAGNFLNYISLIISARIPFIKWPRLAYTSWSNHLTFKINLMKIQLK